MDSGRKRKLLVAGGVVVAVAAVLAALVFGVRMGLRNSGNASVAPSAAGPATGTDRYWEEAGVSPALLTEGQYAALEYARDKGLSRLQRAALLDDVRAGNEPGGTPETEASLKAKVDAKVTENFAKLKQMTDDNVQITYAKYDYLTKTLVFFKDDIWPADSPEDPRNEVYGDTSSPTNYVHTRQKYEEDPRDSDVLPSGNAYTQHLDSQDVNQLPWAYQPYGNRPRVDGITSTNGIPATVFGGVSDADRVDDGIEYYTGEITRNKDGVITVIGDIDTTEWSYGEYDRETGQLSGNYYCPKWATYTENGGRDWIRDAATEAETVKFISDSRDIKPISIAGWLSGFKEIKHLDFIGLDTTWTTNMSHLFQGSKIFLKDAFGNDMSLDVDPSELIPSSVTDLSYMFAGADWYGLNTGTQLTTNAKNLEGMFMGCLAGSIYIPDLKTANAENMKYMFQGCPYLKDITIWEFDTNLAVSLSTPGDNRIEGMFWDCPELTIIDYPPSFTGQWVTYGSYYDLLRNTYGLASGTSFPDSMLPLLPPDVAPPNIDITVKPPTANPGVPDGWAQMFSYS